MRKLLVGVLVLIVLGLLSWKLGGTTSEWNDAEIFVYPATIKRQSGFTSHPSYLEVAEKFVTGAVSL
jgi:hypothetical protein